MKTFAVLQLSGCAGCEVALLNADEWIGSFRLTYMPLVISAYDAPPVDLLLVSGAVHTDEDYHKLRAAAQKTREHGGQVIIPTVHNMLAIEQALTVAARRYVSSERVNMEPERAVGRVVRAFDPCIACATH